MKDGLIKWGIFFIILFVVIWLAGVRVHPEHFNQFKARNYFKRIVTYEPKKNLFLKFSMNKTSSPDKNKSPLERAMFDEFFYPKKKTSAPPPQKPIPSGAMMSADELASEMEGSSYTQNRKDAKNFRDQTGQ